MSFPGRLLDLPFGRVFVHQGGDPTKPELVLIHGFLVSHWYFAPVLEELEKHFHVTALDLPGHGESDRPKASTYAYDFAAHAGTVDAVMEQLGIARAVVYGHSMGGGTALTLAARYPKRVERLLLEDPLVYAPPLELDGKAALIPGVGAFLFRNLYFRKDLANHFRKVFVDKSKLSDEVIDYYWERFNRAGARDAFHANLVKLSQLSDENPDPARVSCPSLIIWGDSDHLVPLRFGEKLAKLIPGTKLVVIPQCGHSPHEEKPEALLAAALPFLLGESAASATG